MNIEDQAIAVIESINKNPAEVDDITEEENECYFRFRGVAFSIQRISLANSNIYSLYVYPKWTASSADLSEMLQYGNGDEVVVTSFPANELPKSAQPLLRNLYRTITATSQGIDKIFAKLLADEHIDENA